MVDANFVKAIIEATSQVSKVSTKEIVAMATKGKIFDDLVEFSGIDFMYYAAYEFLPKRYANILSAVQCH